MIRIDDDAKLVRVGTDVAPTQPPDDAVRMRVVRAHEDVEKAIIVDDTGRRGKGRVTSLGGFDLAEVVDHDRIAPHGVAVPAIEHRRLRYPHRARDVRRRRCAGDEAVSTDRVLGERQARAQCTEGERYDEERRPLTSDL